MSSVSRSKTTVLGATRTGGFLCIHDIASLAVDGGSDDCGLVGTKGPHSVSGSTQDRRRLVNGEAIALNQVRLLQDV